ncbi:MAG: hypothetical protein ACI8QF_000542 [Limisphaerales bacterium]
MNRLHFSALTFFANRILRPVLAVVFVWLSGSCSIAAPRTVETDLLIVGATESGWAAAIQAARAGVKSIAIVHDGEWFGGQYTEQALACVDENKGVGKVGWGVDWHPMKRSFHRSGLFKELMDGIEAFNTEKYGSPMPGKPYHGPSTFRPAEAEAVFRKLIQPYIDSGQVRVIWKKYPVAADVDRSNKEHPRLRGLTFAPVDLQTGKGGEPDLRVVAKLTIDASDWGEAIQVSGAAFECGPDPQSRYGEPSAPKEGSFPANEMNPITWAMIVAESEGESPIPKPARFDDRNFPRATHFSRAAFGKLKWDVPNPGGGSIPHWPPDGEASKRQLSVYSVRRIVDGYSSTDGQTSILLNYMNGQDYPLERLPQHVVDALEATEAGASEKNIVLMTREQRQIIFNDAKRHSRSVLYHMQNFVHERSPDKENSLRKFHLSREFGTPDDLPPKPYIREGLRLKAMYMMREQDGRNRDSETKTGARPRFAHVMYEDGLFAWQFHYDFHRTGRTYLEGEGASGPWIDYHKPNRHTKFLSDRSVFPLRSLVPESMDGLLGAQGNVGNSSIVSAALRLHDQRVHVGQAAGAVAAVALENGVRPREMPYDFDLLELVRLCLCGGTQDAVPLLLWPFRDLPADHLSFVAINQMAASRRLRFDDLDVDFEPNRQVDLDWAADLDLAENVMRSPGFRRRDGITRGQMCKTIWSIPRLGDLPLLGPLFRKNPAPPFDVDGDFRTAVFKRVAPGDADGDGIPDGDDALYLTPNEPIVFKVGEFERDPANDGEPDLPGVANDARFFNFCGPGVKLAKDETGDHGLIFTEARGYGWRRDLRANNRKRNALKGPRDSFVFTRERDVWECAVENGRYRVTLCVGDSGHEQSRQMAMVEGVAVFEEVFTVAGQFAEKTVEARVADGRLTLEIGSGESGSNTCVNWLRLEPIR